MHSLKFSSKNKTTFDIYLHDNNQYPTYSSFNSTQINQFIHHLVVKYIKFNTNKLPHPYDTDCNPHDDYFSQVDCVNNCLLKKYSKNCDVYQIVVYYYI